jgi:hypothetical protein
MKLQKFETSANITKLRYAKLAAAMKDKSSALCITEKQGLEDLSSYLVRNDMAIWD